MTGRGRDATLPAWMTKDTQNLYSNNSTNSINPSNQYNASNYEENSQTISDPRISNNGNKKDDLNKREESIRNGDRDRRRDNSRDREREKRSHRSRSRSKDDRRYGRRSRSRSKGYRDSKEQPKELPREAIAPSNDSSSKSSSGWKPKRSSNFDVKPPDGVELPPITVMSAFGDIPGGEGFAKRDLSIQTRHARRIYVGGIPPTTVERDMTIFFDDVIKRGLPKQYVPQGSPVVSVFLNLDKCFAFIELTSMELASACQKLDGIQYKHSTGTYTLRMRRPHDYRPELVTDLGPIPDFTLAEFQVVSTTVTDGLGKVFIGGLPYHLNDEEVKELLSAFGPLKAFNLVRDPGAAITKGYAFCEYFDMRTTYMAVQGLNEMQIGDKKLTVRVSDGKNTPISQPLPPASSTSFPQPVNPLSGMNFGPLGLLALGNGDGQDGNSLINQSPTRILKLENMVSSDELQDDEEYEDILNDVREECSQYGHVIQVIIPRLKSGFAQNLEGYIFVEFTDSNSAIKAAQNLFGRKFADRTVIVNYFDEINFQNGLLM